MSTLNDWLRQTGFVRGNPFAVMEADRESDLTQYAIDHPALNAILDDERQPASCVLHAPRGAGKSAMRLLFEHHYSRRGRGARPLVISVTDWMPIVARRQAPDFRHGQAHWDALAFQLLRALAAEPDLPAEQIPAEAVAQLAWLYHIYSRQLLPRERVGLKARFPGFDERGLGDDYSLGEVGLVPRLHALADLILALGYSLGYVLIDRIDELLETVNDTGAAADLIQPLLANLPVAEVPRLAFKCFVPTAVVEELIARGVLREERISCIGITWEPEHLFSLLVNRLDFFSDGRIRNLAAIATANARDVDALIVRAAGASPRGLLNLGDALFRACAASASAEGRGRIDLDHLWQVMPNVVREALGQSRAGLAAPLEPAPPLLSIRAGRLWLGDEDQPVWQTLPDLQRQLLSYLYEHRGQICRKEAILALLWPEAPPADDGSLRKLGDRLIRSIEPNPTRPVYIQKLRGGHFRLDYATE
jgi:hypothetical protein